MEIFDQKDGQARGLLLTAARELIAQGAELSVRTLLIRTGVSKAELLRQFAQKDALLAALAEEDVRGLDQVLSSAQPAQKPLMMEQEYRAAVGSDFGPAQVAPTAPVAPAAPQSAPERADAESGGPVVNDAWLERRLRVFERALGSLEKRQEKFEEELAMRLAVIGERLDLVMHQAAQHSPAPAEPARPQAQNVSAEEDGWNAKFEKAEAAGTQRAELGEPAPDLFADIEVGPGSAAAKAQPTENAEASSGASFTDRRQKPISDFVAHGRQLALEAAARADAAPRRPVINLRWLGFGAAALLTVIACAATLAASGKLSPPRPVAAPVTSGTSHRQMARDGISRLIALADSGNASAQTVLALDYLRGENGVASNDAAAERWSKAAAEQGQPMAQYLLGSLYQEDESASGEAVKWFKAAAEQGNLKAMHNLAIAYAEGQGVDKDPSQAVAWFQRAAEQGYCDSEFDLAVLYERGDGVAQSARDALKWYLIAAARGDGPSAERAAFLKKQVDPMVARLAAVDAAHFTLKPMGYFANEMPGL